MGKIVAILSGMDEGKRYFIDKCEDKIVINRCSKTSDMQIVVSTFLQSDYENILIFNDMGRPQRRKIVELYGDDIEIYHFLFGKSISTVYDKTVIMSDDFKNQIDRIISVLKG